MVRVLALLEFWVQGDQGFRRRHLYNIAHDPATIPECCESATVVMSQDVQLTVQPILEPVSYALHDT